MKLFNGFSRTILFSCGVLIVLAAVCFSPRKTLCFAANDAETTSPYRVVWETPSKDWNGTMPLGNGEVGINAYFDASAKLHILLARTDSWDDYGHLAKVGAVEIELTSEQSSENVASTFRQVLDVETGVISAAYGPEGRQIRVKLWVDTNRPVVVVEIESDLDDTSRAFLRPWRIGDGETLTAPMVSDLWHTPDQSEKVTIQNDRVLSTPELKAANRILCYHRNIKTKYYDEIAKTQGLDEFPGYQPDPYVNRTFGLLVYGTDSTWSDEQTLVSSKGRARRFEIATHAAQTDSLDEWLDQIVLIADAAKALPIEKRRNETIGYWRDFAARSWVRFSPNEEATQSLSEEERAAVVAETFDVSRSYALQRFMIACQGRGEYPIKFNGGLFTHAHQNMPSSHDYRRWGPGYWWQNTRLPYYATFSSGDFELTKPLFDKYCALIPLCEYRAKRYLGADGAYFPECIYLDGAVFPETYGLQPWNERDDKLQASGWHKREWVGGLELAFLALQYYEFTQDETFLKEKALPTAKSVVKFFDSYYDVDPATGKLKMSPAQSLETWWDCDNSTPEIAGVRAVLQRLLALPENLTSTNDRAYWNEFLQRVPDVPTRKDADSGLEVLSPAERFADSHNVETPELYPVFPFRLFSFEKPGVELAKNAYAIRRNHFSTGWAQDDIFCSYLGDAEGARENLVKRARNGATSERFPAFWGPNFDWIPDMDNGGVLNTAAPSLALQTDGDKFFIAPALPKMWNVDFKLWTSKNTTVQGTIENGKISSLEIVPPERAKDATICVPTAFAEK